MSLLLFSSSIAQVHKAKLLDGRVVAVKVKRPGIEGKLLGDIQAYAFIHTYIHTHPDGSSSIKVYIYIHTYIHTYIQRMCISFHSNNNKLNI